MSLCQVSLFRYAFGLIIPFDYLEMLLKLGIQIKSNRKFEAELWSTSMNKSFLGNY